MTRPDLHLDWCSHDAAKYAVERWHYSRSMPAGKTLKIGVWETDRYIGAIIFSRGSNQHLGKQFGLTINQVCELTRVALDQHQTPVTRMMRIALKLLSKRCPGIRLIISYADCDQAHHGGIYAGGNWIYLGKVQLNGGTPKYLVHGRVMHGRSVAGRGWKQNVDWLREHVDPRAKKVYTDGKHKYAMGQDRDMVSTLKPHAQPYPKRAGSTDGGAPDDQSGGGGSIPTPALSQSDSP